MGGSVMKKTCFGCKRIITTGDPIPEGYDNEAAKSSTICPECFPEFKRQNDEIIQKLSVQHLMKRLGDKI